MSYKFKVGDKGLTENGLAYEVLFIDSKLPEACQLYARVEKYTTLQSFSVKGRSYSWRELELIPPKLKLWVVVYKDDGDNYCSVIRLTEESAEYTATAYRVQEFTVIGIREIEIGESK